MFALGLLITTFSKHDIFYLEASMRMLEPAVRNLGFLDSESFMIKFFYR